MKIFAKAKYLYSVQVCDATEAALFLYSRVKKILSLNIIIY